MTRRIVWIAVLVLAVLGIGGSWFLTHFERVPVKVRAAEEAAARRDPYLALERFLARMGRPLVRERDALALDRLPAGGVLILDRQRRHHMQPARVDRLLAWVDQGGYLILAPERRGVADPLLDRLGAGWRDRRRPRPETVEEGEDGEDQDRRAEEPGPPPPPRRAKAAPERIVVAPPGADRPLAVRFLGGGLAAGKRAPAWRAGTEAHGDQFLHYAHGQGQITVAGDLGALLRNRTLGEEDHAELLWTLLGTYQPRGPVILAARLTVPTLGEWLATSAWTALIAAGALIGLWLWRRLPRFGPVRPEPAPDRRELSEHLAAVGRYVWRAGGLSHWLAVAREDFQGRLALRHPALAALPPAEQAAALARLTRRAESRIAAALAGPADSPPAFTDALRTLHHLERSL